MTLDEVEVGMEIVVWSYGTSSVAKIGRVLKTQLELENGRKYSKITGREIGKYASARNYVYPRTPQEMVEYRENKQKELDLIDLRRTTKYELMNIKQGNQVAPNIRDPD